ncbi:MAG TPA: hypothetical protein VNS09_07970 [Solirubrobacter sp.]|nr:hypothetical protein [Solirubrobacter sp.]
MNRRLALVLAAAVACLAAAPTADAQTRITVKKGSAVDLTAAGAPENEYDVNSGSDPSAFCGKGVPLTVGWTGATAPVAGTQVYLTGPNTYVELDPRRPKAAGKLRAVAVCATGKGLRPSVKVAQNGTSVSCGAKLTLGLAATESWPYIEEPIVVGPSGANGWTAAAGARPRPTAICVARSAFKNIKTVRRTGTFDAGSATATLSASCGGAGRVLAWGYEAAPIAGNTWRSAESSSARSVPFVGDATPTAGAKGFKITLRTADNAPATASAPVALSVRCGVPAGG